MRRCAVGLVVLVLSTLAAPASATHRWTWASTIVMPRIDVPDDPDMLARCDYLIRGADSQLWLGFMIDLPPQLTTGTTRFTLVDGLMGGTPEPNNPDVTFFSALGGCSPAEPPAIVERLFGPDVKRGIIPAGARYALVTIPGDALSTFVFETDVEVAH